MIDHSRSTIWWSVFSFHFCDEAQVTIIKSSGLGFSFKGENIWGNCQNSQKLAEKLP